MLVSTNQSIQKNRMLRYFIRSTQEIIEQEGVERVTLRNISQKAGYSTAALYRYFEDLEELIIISSLKYSKDYLREVSPFFAQNPLSAEAYLLSWQAFMTCVLKYPQIFYRMLFGRYRDRLGELIRSYEELFPEDKIVYERFNLAQFEGKGIANYTLFLLQGYAQDNAMPLEDLSCLNDMMLNCMQSALAQKCTDPSLSSKDLLARFMKQVAFLLPKIQ